VGGVDISLAGGWIEVASIVRPPGEVVVSMRPVSVFAKGPGSEIEQLRAELQGRWRQAARAVMVLLSLHELSPAQIAALLDCHPATVRRWIGRFNDEGLVLATSLFGDVSATLREYGSATLDEHCRYLLTESRSALTATCAVAASRTTG
jgi:hypothetical protein